MQKPSLQGTPVIFGAGRPLGATVTSDLDGSLTLLLA